MKQGTASVAGSARQKGRKRQVKSWRQKHGTGDAMTTKAKPRYVLNKKALQHYLIDHDLTQADFAEILGISHRLISTS